MQKEKYGFVYIWRDRKHNRYYIGSHWGTVDDGYICSSDWMRHALKRRPNDFKRRILKIVNTNRQDLLQEEQKWLNLIKKEEFKKKYFNFTKFIRNPWWLDPTRAKTIGERISKSSLGKEISKETREKISKSMTGCVHSEEHRKKLSTSQIGKVHSDETKEKISKSLIGNVAWNKGKKLSEEHRKKLSESHKGKVAWNKGKHYKHGKI